MQTLFNDGNPNNSEENPIELPGPIVSYVLFSEKHTEKEFVSLYDRSFDKESDFQ